MDKDHPQAHRPELKPEGKAYKAPQKSVQTKHAQPANSLNKPAPASAGPSQTFQNGWPATQPPVGGTTPPTPFAAKKKK